MYFLISFITILVTLMIIIGSLIVFIWVTTKLIPKKAGDGLLLLFILTAMLVWLAFVGALVSTSEHYSRTDVEYQRDK